MDGVRDFWYQHGIRGSAYQNTKLAEFRSHDLIVRAVDQGVMANSYIPRVLGECREPSRSGFRSRTVWSLQNSFTELFKGRVYQLPKRTMRLH